MSKGDDILSNEGRRKDMISCSVSEKKKASAKSEKDEEETEEAKEE